MSHITESGSITWRAMRIALLTMVVLNSCTFHIGKDPEPSSGGGGTGGTGPSISFLNTTFTDINVKLDGETKTATSFGVAIFSGKAGASATYSAEAFVKNTAGTQVGQKATWTGSSNFPASGSTTVELEVPKDFYLLKVTNSSGLTVNKVTANSGLAGSASDNVQIASSTGSTITDVGYYKATANGNLKFDFTNGTNKTFTNLTFPNEVNQLTTASLTPSGGGAIFTIGGDGGTGGSGSGSGTGGTGATITLSNGTFTVISATLNGVTKDIPVAGSAVFDGNPNSNATYTAETSGKTTNGTQVGVKITWSNTNTFPALGNNKTINLIVTNSHFFLSITNKSSKIIDKIIVNEGQGTDAFTENITLAANGAKFAIGYYKALSNSTVKVFSNNTPLTLSPSSIVFPNTDNQSISLDANN